MMKAARTSETLVNFYQTARRYNPEDSHLPILRCFSFIFYSFFFFAALGHRLVCLVVKSKVHYRVHKSPPLVPILIHMNPIHTLTLYLFKISLIIYPHIYTWASYVTSSLQIFLLQICVHFSFSSCVLYSHPLHPSLLNLK
jgi:hypothetical protein